MQTQPLWDFAKSCNETSYRILKQCTGVIYMMLFGISFHIFMNNIRLNRHQITTKKFISLMLNLEYSLRTWLTHWGRVTHICVSNLTIIGSDNGLSPGRRQAIIWTSDGILWIGSLGRNFSEILIEFLIFWFKKMRLNVSSAKWRPFCLGLNVLIQCLSLTGCLRHQVLGSCGIDYKGHMNFCLFAGTFLPVSK